MWEAYCSGTYANGHTVDCSGFIWGTYTDIVVLCAPELIGICDLYVVIWKPYFWHKHGSNIHQNSEGAINDTILFLMFRWLLRGIIWFLVPVIVPVLASQSCAIDDDTYDMWSWWHYSTKKSTGHLILITLTSGFEWCHECCCWPPTVPALTLMASHDQKIKWWRFLILLLYVELRSIRFLAKKCYLLWFTSFCLPYRNASSGLPGIWCRFLILLIESWSKLVFSRTKELL